MIPRTIVLVGLFVSIVQAAAGDDASDVATFWKRKLGTAERMVISDVNPSSSVVVATDRSVRFRAKVTDTEASIKNVKFIVRHQVGSPQKYKVTKSVGNSYYEYTLTGAPEGGYCFVVEGRNSNKDKNRATTQCFELRYATPYPTSVPSLQPTDFPTLIPSNVPSLGPTTTSLPSSSPSTSAPSQAPSSFPSTTPTTSMPSLNPSGQPSYSPTVYPSGAPSSRPSQSPTESPSGSTKPSFTTGLPSYMPSPQPSPTPSDEPSPAPSTSEPTTEPSPNPTKQPTNSPTSRPTSSPIEQIEVRNGLQAEGCDRDDSRYNICLDLKALDGGVHPWMESFITARRIWEQVIVGDEPDLYNFDEAATGSGYTATGYPSWDRNNKVTNKKKRIVGQYVDDVYIAGVESEIDGRGKVLGSAGPRYLRNDDGVHWHALTGWMEFDTDDIADLVEDGTWEGVILHEMGHVLGIGTLWDNNEFHSGGRKDDIYTGSKAAAEWYAIGCNHTNDQLPVEKDGGSGTAGSHWDENCLDAELMTGYNDQNAKLSRITIASLDDMGYTVSYGAASPYGLEDLGDCRGYCKAREEMDDERRLNLKRKPPLTTENVDVAVAYGQNRLKKSKQEATESGMQFELAEKITVLVQQDGLVYGVEVTGEQDSNIFVHDGTERRNGLRRFAPFKQ